MTIITSCYLHIDKRTGWGYGKGWKSREDNRAERKGRGPVLHYIFAFFFCAGAIRSLTLFTLVIIYMGQKVMGESNFFSCHRFVWEHLLW